MSLMLERVKVALKKDRQVHRKIVGRNALTMPWHFRGCEVRSVIDVVDKYKLIVMYTPLPILVPSNRRLAVLRHLNKANRKSLGIGVTLSGDSNSETGRVVCRAFRQFPEPEQVSRLIYGLRIGTMRLLEDVFPAVMRTIFTESNPFLLPAVIRDWNSDIVEEPHAKL